MTLEKGDMVLIHYVGRDSNGEIFDLSDEEVAEEKGVKDERVDYGPVPVLIGEGYVIEGLEETLKDMEPGDERDIEVPSEKAYGSRTTDNIETYRESEFREQEVTVNTGDRIMVGDKQGRVVSKGSGRVRVDFNHPLAGEDLSYSLEVLEKIEEDREIARRITEYRTGGDVEFEDGKAILKDTEDVPEGVKQEAAEEIERYTGLEAETG
jgi:FKBP-type peptidyl-prolyl cis-trans isomerase SlyD